MSEKNTFKLFPVYLSATEMELQKEYSEAVLELIEHLHSFSAEPFPIEGDLRRKLLARALLIAITVLTILNAPHRPKYGASLDATALLEKIDLGTFPPRSVIIAMWNESLPLLYEQYMLETRPDINIVMAQAGNWLRMAEGFGGRPVFLMHKDNSFEDRELIPFRNVWRVE